MPVFEELKAIQTKLIEERKRHVTFTEVVQDLLVAYYEKQRDESHMYYKTVPDPKFFENAMDCLTALYKVADKKINNPVKVIDVTKKAYEWFNIDSNEVEGRNILKYLEDHKLITRIESDSETIIAITDEGEKIAIERL